MLTTRKGGEQVEKSVHIGQAASKQAADRRLVPKPLARASSLVEATHAQRPVPALRRVRSDLALSLVGVLGRPDRRRRRSSRTIPGRAPRRSRETRRTHISRAILPVRKSHHRVLPTVLTFGPSGLPTRPPPSPSPAMLSLEIRRAGTRALPRGIRPGAGLKNAHLFSCPHTALVDPPGQPKRSRPSFLVNNACAPKPAPRRCYLCDVAWRQTRHNDARPPDMAAPRRRRATFTGNDGS